MSFGAARPGGCPLHNLIPEWNELVYRGQWDRAAARLALTSPLPFTSRVCPALCEAACNLNVVDGEPTTIHDNERAISDWESAHGGPARFEPAPEGAPRVAVVGSRPRRPCLRLGARSPPRTSPSSSATTARAAC